MDSVADAVIAVFWKEQIAVVYQLIQDRMHSRQDKQSEKNVCHM